MSPESSSAATNGEKHHGVSVSTWDIDTAAQLASGFSETLDPGTDLRLRKKIDRHILPLMYILYCIQSIDKATLGSTAILGIQTATHLTVNQYNWLSTVFFLSYLLFEFPQNLALQRFPVGKWMSINMLIWGIALACHAACTNFAGLFVVRFLLGMCEGSVTAGFLIVTSMFYTRKEQTLRIGYWSMMNGVGGIISGFLAFGTLHIKTSGFEPWQWFMIITGVITVILACCYWFLFPDSPANAWFLTPEERVMVVQRIKGNQTGVENKYFKREQFIEVLCDPKTWLFAAFFGLLDVTYSITAQQNLIIASLGFTILQTTLLGCIPAAVLILFIYLGVNLAACTRNSRGYLAATSFVPTLIGVALVNFLPWSNKAGLLAGQCLSVISTTGFVLALSWLGNVTAGHTKKVVTNAIILSAFCIGNASGPQMWKAQYKPRNHVPWAVIAACDCICPILLLIIRVLLVRENRRRDAEPPEAMVEYFCEIVKDGEIIEVKVEKEFLDLTDRQNRDFRYVL